MRSTRLVSVPLPGAALAAIALLTACSDPPAAPDQTLVGSQVAVGQGSAHVEAVVSSDGLLKSLTVVLSEAALSGLPQPPAPLPPVPEYVLPMPTGLQTVFDHAALNWQPFGHPPAGVYDRPHFDVHFYLLSMTERDAITPADPGFGAKGARAPAADLIPPGYLGDPAAIPRMGTHWTDGSSAEHHGGAFSRTLIYGFYDGKLAFIEPMMTVAYLQTNPANEAAIALPARFERPGSYPTRWAVRHDQAGGAYRVELRDFVTR